jgi:hypothetical protein
MSASGPHTPAERPHGEPIQAAQMSVAEKLACEWEARHDVAARGHIADVAALQHYLSHTRCDDELHRPSGHEPHPARAPRAAGERRRAVPTGLQQWLRWGEEGRPDAPVIPPG